jgi:hypothetical protein
MLGNGDSHYSLGVVQSETFAEGATALFPQMQTQLKLLPDGTENRSIPPLSIICCKMYSNDGLAESSSIQDKFFSRVLLAKLIQLVVIIFWMLLISAVQSIQDSISGNYEAWFYTSSVFYVALLICVRWVPRKRPQRNFRSAIIVYFLMAFSIAFAVGSIESRFQTNVFFITLMVLVCSLVIIIALTWYGNYKVMSKKTNVAPALITTSTTCFIFLLVNMKTWDFYLEDLAITWLAAFVSATAMLTVYVLELKCVIAGRRFPVSNSDWLFTACFL